MNPLAGMEAALLAKIRPAVAHYVPGVDLEAAEALARDIMADALGLALWGLEKGIRASHTPALGEAVWGSIMRLADEPNGRLVPGLSRRRVSATICRIRANLGLPPESINRSHPLN
jgi:hypothetical protein